MRQGPKNRFAAITLTTEENNRLVEWTRRHETAKTLALRARIVLVCEQIRSNGAMGRQVRATAQTVGKCR